MTTTIITIPSRPPTTVSTAVEKKKKYVHTRYIPRGVFYILYISPKARTIDDTSYAPYPTTDNGPNFTYIIIIYIYICTRITKNVLLSDRHPRWTSSLWTRCLRVARCGANYFLFSSLTPLVFDSP